jgi:very-short-patch-repair endonuclease
VLGIPVTTVARTLVDVAAALDRDELARAGGRRVDCRWPERTLTVELDGYRYHRSRHAWEQDRRREREARARGDDFRRFTYGDLLEDPRYLLAELRALLHDPA